MNVVDIIVVIFLLFGFFIGWHRGFTKQIIAIVGLILSIAFAFAFRGAISNIFYKIFPFFEFGGSLKGVTSLNIIIYEFLAFIIIFSLAMVIYKIIVKVSTLIEKLFNITIILGFFGKIIAGIAGIIENFVVAFLALYILNLPILNFPLVNKSMISNFILEKTPVMSELCDDTLNIYNEIVVLKNDYRNEADNNKLNNDIVNMLLEHKFVTKENVLYLMEHKKLENITLENR